MVNTFKPGDKVRCIDADYYLVEGEVYEVESSRLDTSGYEFVNIVDPLWPGGVDGPFFAGRFEPVAEEPVKMFGTLAPIIDGQKESDNVTTEITGLHRKDIQLIADELQREAEDGGWRSEYGEFLERINKMLSVKLEPSPSPEKEFWTEFSFRYGDVLVSLTGYTHLRVAGGSAWRDDTDRLTNDFDSEARGRLIRGASKLYRHGIQVTPPEF